MPITLHNHEHHVLVQRVDDTNVIDHLPPRVYRIGLTMAGPIFIKDREKFNAPEKIYGNHAGIYAEIRRGFEGEDGMTGVILEGQKGGGKTMMAESLCNHALNLDMPVLMITEDFSAEMLASMIKLAMPCAVLFDEFGKVFDEEKRSKLLTLFSDSDLKKVMMIVTNNERDELNDFMIDRPGRFKYRVQYSYTDVELAKEMMEDLGTPEGVRQTILDYVHRQNISFDVLRFVINEAARFDDGFKLNKHLGILNVPSAVYPHYDIFDVKFKGEPFLGAVKLKADNYDFEIELFDDDINMVASEQFNWNTVKKLEQHADQWRVAITPELIVTLHRSVMGRVMRAASKRSQKDIDAEKAAEETRRAELKEKGIDPDQSIGRGMRMPHLGGMHLPGAYAS